MAILLTIGQIIEIGDVSVYLASNENSRGALFGKKIASPISPVEIAMYTDALRWGNEDDGDDIDNTVLLRQTANYVLWCCGKYGQQAQNIISGSGGGTVQPSSPSFRPTPLDFIVSASSTIPTGASGATIASFVGWNLQFDRNGITQNTTDVGDGSSYYGWDRATATFSCSPALQENELVRLTPV